MPPPGPLADRLGLCPSLPGPLTWGSPLGGSGPAQPCPTFRSGKALAWNLLLPSTPDPQSAVLLRLGQCPLAMALPLPPNHPRALHCLPPDPPPFGSIKSQSTLPWPSWHGASSLLPRHPAELTNSLMCQASAQPPLCQGTHGFLSSTWVAQLLKLSPSRCIRMVPTQVLQGLSQCLLRPVSNPAPAPATPNPPWIPSPRPHPSPSPHPGSRTGPPCPYLLSSQPLFPSCAHRHRDVCKYAHTCTHGKGSSLPSFRRLRGLSAGLHAQPAPCTVCAFTAWGLPAKSSPHPSTGSPLHPEPLKGAEACMPP